jgi:hypothetical protein
MSTFDEREKSFERKFELDQEIAFKLKARRNKIVGHWAASILGKQGADEESYVKEMVALELGSHGEEHVIERLVKDLAAKGIDRPRVLAELDNAAAQAKKELGA